MLVVVPVVAVTVVVLISLQLLQSSGQFFLTDSPTRRSSQFFLSIAHSFSSSIFPLHDGVVVVSVVTVVVSVVWLQEAHKTGHLIRADSRKPGRVQSVGNRSKESWQSSGSTSPLQFSSVVVVAEVDVDVVDVSDVAVSVEVIVKLVAVVLVRDVVAVSVVAVLVVVVGQVPHITGHALFTESTLPQN
jgi:hypothetical protein